MDKELVVGADIGGSHITAALVDLESGAVLEDTVQKQAVNAAAGAGEILQRWASAIDRAIQAVTVNVPAIGIAMPGPFDYPNGVSLIKGVAKYEALYGANIRTALKQALDFPGSIYFGNDASCFALGEAWAGEGAGCSRMVAVTLGTGLGGSFLQDNRILQQGAGVPPEGYIYHLPYRNGIAEDYISSRWLISEYQARTGRSLPDVKAISELAEKQDAIALQLFHEMGMALGEVLSPWLREFQAQRLVIGGNIRKAHPFFLPALQQWLLENEVGASVQISSRGERSALAGAAWVCKTAGQA
ncbi:ROK family protein [Chitinophaga japonensis]|nr:ROK family protein [Chitinophaga japonensis]